MEKHRNLRFNRTTSAMGSITVLLCLRFRTPRTFPNMAFLIFLSEICEDILIISRLDISLTRNLWCQLKRFCHHFHFTEMATFPVPLQKLVVVWISCDRSQWRGRHNKWCACVLRAHVRENVRHVQPQEEEEDAQHSFSDKTIVSKVAWISEHSSTPHYVVSKVAWM